MINASALINILNKSNRHINTNSDSELLLNVFANELYTLSDNENELTTDIIFKAVTKTMRYCSGGYAVVVSIQNYGLLAFRDPNGIRPLIYGRRMSSSGKYDYCVVSESVVLDVLGYEIVDDVNPGECIYINLNGELNKKECVKNSKLNPCIFEYIYFSRTDSVIDHVPVSSARENMGIELAKEILRLHPDNDIDIICPIPETSRTMALSAAKYMNKPYAEGIIKNRYIARTFIMPGQTMRMSSVRLKLNPLRVFYYLIIRVY